MTHSLVRRLSVAAVPILVFAAAAQCQAQVRTGWYRNPRSFVGVAVPYGGYYGGYGYGTGLGDVIRAQGEYNLNTSEAMINYEETRSRYIDNMLKWQQVYYERQRMGKEAQAQKYAEARATRERWYASRQPGAPPRLTPTQLDPSTGKIYWPEALREPAFAKSRQKLEELYVLRAHTGPTAEVAKSIRDAAREMQEELKSKIRDLVPNQYLEARKFLESLGWEGQFPATT